MNDLTGIERAELSRIFSNKRLIRLGFATVIFIVSVVSISSCRKSTPVYIFSDQPQAKPQATETRVLSADEQSCKIFVQDFYTWYTPIATSGKDRLTVSLRLRQSSFDQKLWKMLVADDIAQSRAKEIVGLDFDPILYSQDHYCPRQENR